MAHKSGRDMRQRYATGAAWPVIRRKAAPANAGLEAEREERIRRNAKHRRIDEKGKRAAKRCDRRSLSFFGRPRGRGFERNGYIDRALFRGDERIAGELGFPGQGPLFPEQGTLCGCAVYGARRKGFFRQTGGGQHVQRFRFQIYRTSQYGGAGRWNEFGISGTRPGAGRRNGACGQNGRPRLPHLCGAWRRRDGRRFKLWSHDGGGSL